MLIDTHAHLDFTDYAADLQEVLQRAAEAGIGRIITISTTLASAQRAIALASESATRTDPNGRPLPQISATVGIHPLYVEETPDDFLTTLRGYASHPSVVALGETGLDYHRAPKPPEANEAREAWETNRVRQADFFKQQLGLARESGLNVVIHQRESWEDTLRVLRPFAGSLKAVFHCFGGTLAQAQEVIELGFFVSFTGIVTFKNATSVQQTAAQLPAGCFFLETDCPFLAPTPHRGKRCEPSHTRLTAEYIARLRGESLESLSEHTSATAQAFFRRR
jgi:TatD DNase family protein